jgi:hypothetical protein
MRRFSSFEFYKDEWRGNLSEDEYDQFVGRAYDEIMSQTNNRALAGGVNTCGCSKTERTDLMEQNIKLCECALTDLFAGYANTEQMLPKGVTSIDNDGYKISAGSGGMSISSTEAKEIATICTRYLQVPVNLMDRWL